MEWELLKVCTFSMPNIYFPAGEEDYNTGEPITEIVFSAGDVVQSVFFIIINDAISEGTETFTFLLNTTEEFVSLFPATATVTISDNSGE